MEEFSSFLAFERDEEKWPRSSSIYQMSSWLFLIIDDYWVIKDKWTLSRSMKKKSDPIDDRNVFKYMIICDMLRI